MLKLSGRYRIDINQAIAWNYPVAALLTLIIYRPVFTGLQQAPWLIYGSLGILLPALFIIIGLSVLRNGIVRTDVAQRLSVLVPLAASFSLFGESLPGGKMAGIVLGLAAVVLSIPFRRQPDQAVSGSGKAVYTSWICLVLVFAGMGAIDILFKEIAALKSVPYFTSLFLVYVLSFLVGSCWFAWLVLTKRARFEWINMVCGGILGLFNFGNILFYVKAHQAEAARPSLIFTGMNIGVIVAGSLVGLLIFREKLSLLNKTGLVLAVIAIWMIHST
ncbi:EamA/RhaT family transporter [Hufsiella ginkgonis]|nr:EamA/RhaT family transporter [Hufsiella ginkgonis]